MIVNNIIDFPNEWDSEKIIKIGNYLTQEYGSIENVVLHVDTKSFNKMRDDWSNSPGYGDVFSPGLVQLRMFIAGGSISIIPTPANVDFIEFTANNIQHHFKISNKIKEYRNEFEDLVNKD